MNDKQRQELMNQYIRRGMTRQKAAALSGVRDAFIKRQPRPR